MRSLQLQGRASLLVLDLHPTDADPFPLEARLMEARPGAIMFDLSVRDAMRVRGGAAPKGWAGAWAHLSGNEEALTVAYQRALEWGDRNDAEILPLDSDDGPGFMMRRRLKAIAEKADADLDALWVLARKDEEVRSVLDSRRDALLASVERVMERELPRPAVVMAAPFGRFVGRTIGSRMGLVPAGAPGGGWPE